MNAASSSPGPGPRTLVVTGGSAGIGAATAAAFAAAGWDVVSLARRPCPVSGALSVAIDFGVGDWERVVERSVLPLVRDGVVCVVHNAALLHKDDALHLTAEALRHVLDVNVVVPAVLNRLLAPRMGPGSSILFVGSTLSEKAVKNTASYVTSKHALVGLMRATCQDNAGRGIHTACVCPGFVDTEMLRAHTRHDNGVLQALAAMSGHGRLIRPDEIAALLLSCATQPVVDGAVIHANLGQVQS
ncbi:MAG: SDR family oxidoreductase [Deltaproteobacteria bacterium]|nr:SDR family oxidoreductase [Deltaproteobacteria bacterium]